MRAIRLRNTSQFMRHTISKSGTAGECLMFSCIGAIAIAVILALFLVTGCSGSNDSDSIYETPEFVYVTVSVQIPGEVEGIRHLTYDDGKLYFISDVYVHDEETYTNTYSSSIYSMNMDGTGLIRLTGYTPPASLPDGASGGVSINALTVGSDGYFWVAENYSFSMYDLPEGFDYERDADTLRDYYVEIESGTAIRKLDREGAEVQAVDLSGIQSRHQNIWVNALEIDGSGNIYICTYDDMGSRVIYVLSKTGDMLFELTTDSWFNEFIRLPDGTIGFASEQYNENGYSRVLQTIDSSIKSYGDTIALPSVGWEFYPGGGGYDILIGDNDSIYGFTIGEDEAVKLLSWLESDIIANNMQNITILPDGRILCTSQSWDRFGNSSSTEILVLTKTPYSEIPEKTTITLAAWSVPHNIGEAVVEFNRSNPDYRVQIIDYSVFDSEDDWTAGLTRLSTEIVSGKVPDILSVSNLPYKEYAAKGLLADLYPFIDSDPMLDRSDFMQGVFTAAEIDGHLYQAFPVFNVQTLIGHPSVVGLNPGWTTDEFMAVLDAHPDADMPLGVWLTKTIFLEASLAFGMDNYIDWESGTVHFDTPDFIRLLELANAFPDDIDWSSAMGSVVPSAVEDIPEDEAIAAGRQIMARFTLRDFPDFLYYKQVFGGDFVFKGFPNENKNGTALITESGLAITSQSADKEAAWAFVRTILDKDWQTKNIMGGLPTNRGAFDVRAEEALEMAEDSHVYNNIILRPPVQADIDTVITLISSAHGTSGWNVDQKVWEIISESVTDYFSGAVSAEDAARVIQSRMAILVSERS